MKLTVNNITKKFGKKVILDGISASFEQGRSYALLGRNGTGKSTLINIIMQRTRASGSVMIDDKKIADNDALMQYLFCMNDTTFYPGWFRLKTVFSITEAMYPDFDKEYADKLAGDFGIDLKKRISQLSTGQRTMYKVILALASNAPFVFLDEPVLGIDVNQRELFYSTLARKMAEERSCFIICTHIIEEIENLLETVMIIHNGKLIMNISVMELLEKTAAVSGRADETDAFVSQSSVKVIGEETMGAYKKIVFIR